MKAEEIRKLTLEEISKKIIECKDELFALRMQQSAGTLTQTHRINELRKTIARLKTVQNEKMNGGN